MLFFSLLLFSSAVNAGTPDLEVFNRSDSSYNVSTFINRGKPGNCRSDLVNEFVAAGCTRASARGYENIEQFTCYNKGGAPGLADYYIIYQNDLLDRMEGHTPSQKIKESTVHCEDENYTVFAWNIF